MICSVGQHLPLQHSMVSPEVIKEQVVWYSIVVSKSLKPVVQRIRQPIRSHVKAHGPWEAGGRIKKWSLDPGKAGCLFPGLP